MSGLVLPNALPEIPVDSMPAPVANAVGFAIATKEGPRFFVVGGMTPLQTIAGQIAAAMSSGPAYSDWKPEQIASLAKDRAQAVLDACGGIEE